MGVLHAAPVCGGFPLLADSRQKSQLLHTAQGGNATMPHPSGGCGGCVSTLQLQCKLHLCPRDKKPHQIERRCHFPPVVSHSLGSGQGAHRVRKLPLGLREEAHKD